MSQPPDEATTSELSDKQAMSFSSRDPEADARDAIAEGDLRVLGFALRATSIPGVAATDRQTAIDRCGVRLLKGFGDVVHIDEDLSARQQAFEYAARYNSVVIKRCLKDDL